MVQGHVRAHMGLQEYFLVFKKFSAVQQQQSNSHNILIIQRRHLTKIGEKSESQQTHQL
jgi:hypothetical protein